jgi:hypothetical protein
MNFRSQMRARSEGGVAERLIAPVLKTGRPKGLVSSNLTPSALLLFLLFVVLSDLEQRLATSSLISGQQLPASRAKNRQTMAAHITPRIAAQTTSER